MFKFFDRVIINYEEYVDLCADNKVLRAKLQRKELQTSNLKNMKGAKDKMSYKLVNMDAEFNLDRPYEIFCAHSKKIIMHEGFTNAKDAAEFADKLAADNPGREFIVYGPLSVSKAAIPVETKKWEDRPPAPPKDKMVVLNG